MNNYSSNMIRIVLVVLLLTLIGFLWWNLAGMPSPGKIFGIYTPRSFLILLAGSYLCVWGLYSLLNKKPGKTKFVNFCITTTTFVLLFGLLELAAALNLIDYTKLINWPADYTLGEGWLDSTMELDKELLYRRRPNQRLVGETVGDIAFFAGIPNSTKHKFDVQYDDLGFRNDDELDQASIVVIGDSFIESPLVPTRLTLSNLLGSMFGVRVKNLGQEGYGPQQELIVLKRYGFELQPEVVVWFFFEGNDLSDIQMYDHKIKGWNLSILKYRSFSVRMLKLLGALTSNIEPDESDPDALRKRSANFSSEQEEQIITLYFGYRPETLSSMDLENLEAAKSYIGEANDLAEKADAKFLFVYMPTKVRVYQDYAEFPDVSLSHDLRLNDLPSRLLSWCETNDIACIDLTPALKEAAARGELVFIPDDSHWNARGNEVAAEVIADYLVTQGWLRSEQVQSEASFK